MTGQEMASFRGHVFPLQSVAFSEDGLHVISLGMDGTVEAWDATVGQEGVHLAGSSASAITGTA